jgi:tetratricopeptide (TPR) repeat protein
MEEIRAFVGYSFTEDDAEVVNCFLKYFDQLSNSHPKFSWEHAQDAEPKTIAEKVMALIVNKNVFIGICTQKERVIEQAPLKKRLLYPHQYLIREDQFYWKTSDWIIQEIGLAKGLDLEIILLIEDGVRIPGGLQGDLEYIKFDRAAPEKAFGKILEMLTALSPKYPRTAGTASSTQPAADNEQNDTKISLDDYWRTPRPDWTRSEYETAFCVMYEIEDEAGAETINRAYLTTEVASQDDNKNVWEAYCEFIRLMAGKRGSLANLKALAVAYPNSVGVLKNLALGLGIYQDYEGAARVFEDAAMKTQNEIERLQLLQNAAGAHARAGAAETAAKVIDRMREQVRTFGVGEQELLNALKEVAEVIKEDEALLASMERIVYLDPSDTRTRFSLAYKHYEVGNYDLALFHYLRIPYEERKPITWNNLGVVFDQFELPAKSVQAYRKSEEAGETLAMSNLAHKLIAAGFLPEAQQQCNAALKIENYHKNIPYIIARLKEQPDEEDKKEVEILAKAKPISDFYAEYGRALSRSEPCGLAKRWKGPACSLDVTLQGSIFDAKGSYEISHKTLRDFLLGQADNLTSSDKAPPVRYQVEYLGSLRGGAIEGRVIQGRAYEQREGHSVVRENENEARVLMNLSHY